MFESVHKQDIQDLNSENSKFLRMVDAPGSIREIGGKNENATFKHGRLVLRITEARCTIR